MRRFSAAMEVSVAAPTVLVPHASTVVHYVMDQDHYYIIHSDVSLVTLAFTGCLFTVVEVL